MKFSFFLHNLPSGLGIFVLILLLYHISPTTCSIYDDDEWSEWSDWSPCSRTCDGGVTQQFRRCKSPNGCHGVSIKRKMCNMQACGDYRDYREDQCKAFNGRKYNGKHMTWEPYEDPENPCALICKSRETNNVVKLGPKLRDGTRCKAGSLHVCVDGKCEAVGCDLKIGSPKKIDACGVCGGDSRSCTSPGYRWDLESSGPCTVRCGGGVQPVNVVCRNSLSAEKVQPYFCNNVKKPYLETQTCNIQPCEPEWESGEWSVCSTTCGGGLKIRKVFCAQEKNGTKIQVSDKLCHHIRRPSNQDPCNPNPCPHWHAGPWSLCSVTCGKGYQTRNVVCRDSSNLPNSNCDIRLKPGETKSCFEEECPTTPVPFKTTPTSSEPVMHRSPTKKRKVKTTPADTLPPIVYSTPTQDSVEEYPTPEIDNDVYVEEELPREHTLPLVQPYPPMDNAVMFDSNALPSEPTFVAGEWSPCSATCGEGQRTREVNCKIFLEFSRTIANLPDKECPGPKPAGAEPCFASSCPFGDEVGERLADVHQAALADSDTQPTGRKTMSVGLPPGFTHQDMTFSWKVMGYTPCSTSCLGGIQDAMIQCVRDYDQRIATPVLCMDRPQPDIATTRTCNDHPCPPRWNVTDFGPCSKPCGGGVMTREVTCIHEVTRGNTVIVPNNICPSGMPRMEKLCNTVNCPPYWEPGEWGKCSKSCGGGIRVRTIHCKQISALGQVVELSNGDLHCTSPKPAETKSCNKKSCSKVTKPGSMHQQQQGNEEEPEYREKVTLSVKGRSVVYAGTQLRLRCPSGKGMDRGSLIWMKGHEYLKVQPERMELIHKAGILKIKNTTFSDSGVYICVFNGRPVSNITLMIKPFTGDRNKPRGRTNVHDSTLYADQQLRGPKVGQLRSWISPLDENFERETENPYFTPQQLRTLDPVKFVQENNNEESNMLGNWRQEGSQMSSVQDNVSEVNYANGSLPSPPRLASQFKNVPTTLPSLEEDDELSKVERLLSKKMNRRGSVLPIQSLESGSIRNENFIAGTLWVTGKWTECLDSECFNWNTALKRRPVSCQFPNGSSVSVVTVSTERMWLHRQCDPLEKPVEVMECYNPKCLGEWHTLSWSFCKATCGDVGFKTRVLQCLWHGSGRPAGTACQSLPRPLTTKTCVGPPCEKNNSKVKKVRKHKKSHSRHKSSNQGRSATTSSSPTPTISSITARKKVESNELLDYWDLYDEDALV